ncbi:MAG TPA: SGNH/GDSL hydrolase family protein [Acidimicrobiales bacterium]|nr:SGNH/GDSL hydrolase family protein [Acidimicrobiales bacterium]
MRSRLVAAALALALVLAAAGGLALLRLPRNRPPELAVAPALRVLVGGALDTRLIATDADGDPLRWSSAGLPAGAVLEPDGRLRWSPAPDQAGTFPVTVTVRDDDGAPAAARLDLLVRHPPRPDLYVAMGDSVASGHGLELADWLGRDPCWRDADDSYPARLLDRRLRGPAPNGHGTPALRHLALVACSGHTSTDLVTAPVDGGPDLPGRPARMTQLDWAVAANPGLVTVTIGANDLGIGRPGRVVAAGGRVDDGFVRARLDRLEANLAAAVRRLVDATDARVIVSTYHDPTAETPQGVDGCREACFKRAASAVVAALNATVRSAAATADPGRVAVADVAGAFRGHGAPNGRGPDVLRSGDGPLDFPALLGWAGDVHPFCAKGHGGSGRTWVSAADCIHPNRAGAEAYADAMDGAWRSARWQPA